MTRENISLVERAWTAALVVVTGLARLVPHPWNATPMGGVALFGGSRLGLALALTLPLGILAGTDALIWWWKGWSPFNPVVYASFLIYVLLGYFLLRKPTALSILGVSFLGSLQFFLLTNFAIWVSASVPVGDLGGAAWGWVPSNTSAYPSLLKYTADVWGLLACYGMALPFYGGTLLGDLAYPLVLFGLHAALIAPTGERAAVPAR